MARQNLALRMRQIERIIADDPYTVAAYRRGTPADVAETVFSGIHAAICPAGVRGMPTSATTIGQPGEMPPAKNTYVMLTLPTAAVLRARDDIVAVHDITGQVLRFTVISAMHYPFKQEVILDSTE